MSDDCIELLKNWTPDKMTFPAVIQQKWDGVPVRIRNIGGHHFAFSRQNENYTGSIPHIMQAAKPLLQQIGSSITMELIIPGYTFKKISGLVRTNGGNPECLKLIGKIFDADLRADASMEYAVRLYDLATKWDSVHASIVGCVRVDNATAAEKWYDRFMEANPDAEGCVVHSLSKKYQPGKRCWGTQRMKPKPTIDLRVHSFTEAISKETGLGLGMIGNTNCYYKHKKGKKSFDTTGVGPGKFNHDERRDLWAKYGAQVDPDVPLLEVQYMEDDSYDALRQPTAQRWRPDKTVPDHE